MGEIQKHTETNGDLEQANGTPIGWLLVIVIVLTVAYSKLHWPGVLAATIIIVVSLISIHIRKPKKLAIGTKAFVTKEIWAARDPQTLLLMYKIEQLKSVYLSSTNYKALLNQKMAVGDLVKLPEQTAISIRGYFDVHTCKFQVLEGAHSGAIYYGPSRFIKEETIPGG